MEADAVDGDRRSESCGSVDVMRIDLCGDSRAPGLARRALDLVVGIDGVRDDARLAVSELVSNAVRHSGCATSDLIEVRARLGEEVLELSVTDPGFSRGIPRVRLRGGDESGGCGLLIVQQLASRWGAARTDSGGCRVWVELAIRSRRSERGTR